MRLGHRWRISLGNNAGVSVTVTVTARLMKIGSQGLVYSNLLTLMNNVVIGAGAWANGTEVLNNAGNEQWQAAQLLITSPTSTTHALEVQLQNANDDVPNWPISGGGINVGWITRSPAGTLAHNILIR